VNKKGKPFKGRNCARKVAVEFRYMEADMYNLVPAIGELNSMRSNYGYAMIPGEKRKFGKCDMEIEDRKAEPAPEKRGISPGSTFIWSGPILDMGSFRRKIGNYFRHGIRKTRLTNGNVKGARGLRVQGNENPFVKKACVEGGFGDAS